MSRDETENEERSTFDQLLSGELTLEPHPELMALQAACAEKIEAYNKLPTSDFETLGKKAQELFGHVAHPSFVKPPVFADYGINISIGSGTFINFNCTLLDGNKITIGNGVAIGPNCQLLTANHPVEKDKRIVPWPQDPQFPQRYGSVTAPIVLKDRCWIGAGVIILPGVTIGENTVIGAGSIVTKSIPDNVVAAGNPCRIIREINN